MSLTGTPASACLRIETIWVSVKRDFFMEPPGWGKHARKFYLWGVCGSGKLTLTLPPGSALRYDFSAVILTGPHPVITQVADVEVLGGQTDFVPADNEALLSLRNDELFANGFNP